MSRWFLVRTREGWKARRMIAPLGVPIFARPKYRGPYRDEAHADLARAILGLV